MEAINTSLDLGYFATESIKDVDVQWVSFTCEQFNVTQSDWCRVERGQMGFAYGESVLLAKGQCTASPMTCPQTVGFISKFSGLLLHFHATFGFIEVRLDFTKDINATVRVCIKTVAQDAF